MSYKMRTRKQNDIYVNDWGSSDDEDYDSSYSDPDYTRTGPQRRPRKTKVVVNSSINNPMQNNSAAAPAGGDGGGGGAASSSRNAGIVLALAAPRRLPGRPPTERVRVEERPIRRRRRSLLLRRPRLSNWNNGEQNVRKTKTVVSWLIDLGFIRENQAVSYQDPYNDNRRLTGNIRREGVLCDCCAKVITVYDFEEHAHRGELKKPYSNIYFPCWGVSLLDCMNKAWEKLPAELERCPYNAAAPQINATDQNDDACMICADGGDMICCEHCPSTFHSNCMLMLSIPQGDWLCHFCICKFCSNGRLDDVPLRVCVQCEKRFHSDCVQVKPPACIHCQAEFCEMSCFRVFTDIQKKFLGVRNDLGGGYSWSLVRMIQGGQPHSCLDSHKIGVCNSKAAIAWTVMDDIFLTSVDRHTQINIIQSVVYNRASNLMRMNFRGFYTAVLEKNDEIVSVASIRVHGNKVAEMPFIGTRQRFRKKGLLHKLFTEIESALRLLKVELLVIPSVTELEPMWINKYGFSLVKGDLMENLINYNILTFASAVKLQKSLGTKAAGPCAMANTEAALHVAAEGGTTLADAAAGSSAEAATEVVETKNNETGQTQGNNSRKVALFDLNLEPPEDDDDALMQTM